MTASFAQAQDAAVVFDSAFLQADDAAALDMSRFARGNPVLPGHYDVDVWMNGEWQARRPVRFKAWEDRADASPCIAHDELLTYGLDPAAALSVDDDPCLPLDRRMASAATRFNVSEQRLDIEVPQAAMSRQRPGVVPPAQWDHGVTAALLAWRASLRHAASSQRRDTSANVGADAGINAGAWRFRHAGSWAGRRYSHRHAYVERPVAGWRAQLRAGAFPLADDMFAPVRLRGVSLASDARMASDALGGYAPRVKGIAASHAIVRITQNGVLLRELAVPPGPFDVDDLYAAGRGGDIEVDIEEHGKHRTFRVPYFPVPELLREGRTAYALNAGRGVVASGRSPGIVQASWRHGFPGDATVYAGGRLSRGSASLLVGGALATLAGAFSADVTRSRLPGGGRSVLWRMRHGRQWAGGTLVSLGVAQGRDDASRSRSMRRIDVLVQKDLGRRGILAVNASHVGRGRGGTLEQAMSWACGWGSLNMDVALRRSLRGEASGRYRDTSGQLSMSMPLGTPASAANLHATVHGAGHASGARLGIHGSAGETMDAQYGVAVGRDSGQGNRIDASLSRRLAGGEVIATIESSPSTRAASLSASGGLVFHRGGVTPAQRLGDAVALVQARGAQGAGVTGGTDVRIDRRGYAVVPYLTPYRWNAIDLDPAGTSLDVGFVSTHRRVAPTAGAVVSVTFETELAKTVLVTGRLSDGRPLPFGAEVLDIEDRSVGLVGQGGRIFLRTELTSGQWTVRWSGDAASQCVLHLQAGTPTAAGDPRLTGVCE
ncbi:MAG TPA: fimbria/pilus outer membrane usher protein [Luteibacter sp.]|jgi:outer membrane usher protein